MFQMSVACETQFAQSFFQTKNMHILIYWYRIRPTFCVYYNHQHFKRHRMIHGAFCLKQILFYDRTEKHVVFCLKQEDTFIYITMISHDFHALIQKFHIVYIFRCIFVCFVVSWLRRTTLYKTISRVVFGGVLYMQYFVVFSFTFFSLRVKPLFCKNDVSIKSNVHPIWTEQSDFLYAADFMCFVHLIQWSWFLPI